MMEAIDKSRWPEGAWTNEPDTVNYRTADDLHAVVIRSRSGGHLCGYVGIPVSHPLHGKDYGDVDQHIEVHGCLTYSNAGIAKLGEEPSVWYFGFDCAHSCDLCPGYMGHFGGDAFDGTYRDIEYVKREIESLSRQLAALAAAGVQS